MRSLGLLPSVGNIRPTDRIPLGSFIQDVEDFHRKTVDPVTGRMFLKHSLQDDLRDKRMRERLGLDNKQEGIEGQKELDTQDPIDEIREKFIREMSLDSGSQYPSKHQREWAAAQVHIMDKEGIIDEMRQEAQEKGQQFVEPNLELAGVRQAYDHVTEQIKKQGKFEKDIACNDLFEDLLHEKSFSLSKFTQSESADNDTEAERA